MKLKSLIDESKIDFTKTVIKLDCGTRLSHNFEINPIELVSFAKSDYRENTNRGLINSLSNAKRAIDCQVDRILLSLGYELDSLPKNIDQFIDEYCEDNGDYPKKLKLINSLGMAPCSLISEIRTLRNVMEHEYIIPKDFEVKKAIELAELFVSATDRRLLDVWDFEITDSHRQKKGAITGICLGFGSNEKIKAYLAGRHADIEIDVDDEEYPYVMRMCFLIEQEEESLRVLKSILRLCGHPIPSEKIKLVFKPYE